MSNKKTNELRCAGCGKKIEPGTSVFSIKSGKSGAEGEVAEKKIWGVMTEDCFFSAIQSPEYIFQTIMSNANDNAKRSAKKAS